MKKLLLFLLSILCITVKAETVTVVNNTDMTLNMEYPIPEYTKAKLELTSLKSPQEMLYLAILNDSPKDIMLAIQAGADINLKENTKSPILFAISLKRVEAAKVLLQYGATVDESIIDIVLSSDILRNSENKSILFSLLEKCGKKLTYKQFRQAMDLYSTHGRPYGNTFTIFDLLRWTDLAGENGKNIIRESFQKYDAHSMVELFMKNGFNINELWGYVQTHNIQAAKLLLDNGLYINQLWYQDQVYNVEVIKYLIAKGANPNHKIDYGNGYYYTPLAWSISANHLDAAKELIAAGAKVDMKANIPGKGIVSPMDCAINRGSLEIVKLLLEFGA